MQALGAAPASFLAPPAAHLLPATSPSPRGTLSAKAPAPATAATRTRARFTLSPRASRRRFYARAASSGAVATVDDAKKDVLIALSQIIDPDFGTDIVSCGFVKDLEISEALEEFEKKANEVVAALPWVKKVDVTMSAQPAQPIYGGQLPEGLQKISNIIAVSSCKAWLCNSVHTRKSHNSVQVGIFDADVFGPSLPTMVSPENRLLVMNPESKAILPTEYLGVKMVSFGFAGQGRAIMRGPMVSGVINQLLTTTDWFLALQLWRTCATLMLTESVITHSDKVVQQFGIPHLFDLPIRPTLSASGDTGIPEVVADPQGDVAKTFENLGVCVVQQCAKIRQQVSTAVSYDRSIRAIRVKVPDSDEEFLLHPATVRRNDRSAQSVDEWTGEQKVQYGDIPEDIEPEEIRPMGNYAVSITWPDGFSQIAPYDQLEMLERLVDVPRAATPAVASS
ncbi:hypothetical protein PR202_gb04958 [Eleusine coracana subsp. coracana]|uniref:Gamma-butyrobetaine hydroxylase-like N-terminal domain-containing protein n=1 Tax=Eleusine coracana subsp. coracana TaxID=191504 RepID=A0AAV5E5E1_ELECO|nr:hypothetical protein PR202_gb04958 [Eleusine coracana subsp. coracana]